jgi:uncharacterized protein with PIN domain
MADDPKFIADASLGKLAKWLRLLGYDTVVFAGQAGRPMLRQADLEKRIVLTRRQDMAERQFSGIMHLVAGFDIGSQLSEVIDKFSLQINKQKMFGICLKCNARLFPVAKENVRDSVPPYVFANCTEYNECPGCRSIYWAGTHQRNSLQYLDKLIGLANRNK